MHHEQYPRCKRHHDLNMVKSKLLNLFELVDDANHHQLLIKFCIKLFQNFLIEFIFS